MELVELLGGTDEEMTMAGEPTKRMHETWLWCLATLSCGLVGLIFTTVWAAPEPLPSFAVSQEPRFGIVVRTFWKDEDRMTQYLLPNIRMFVNRDMFDFVVVLDDESSADHRYGHCLEKESFTVKYESYPPDSSIFQGVACMGFKSKGYDRQQWSTFHLDLQSEREILGAIDSDACIFTYLTEASVLTNDGRIILRALSTRDSYVADQDALGFDTPFNFMWTDRMPIWFWRSTFKAVRQHISTKFGNITFDEAFRQFSTRQYSQFNIIAHYALKHEPSRYKLVLESSAEGTVNVGDNRCRPGDIRIGCCQTFGVGCQEGDEDETEYLLRYNNGNTSFLHAKQLAHAHYGNVRQEMEHLAPEASSMRFACKQFTALAPECRKPICASASSLDYFSCNDP